MSTAWLSAGAHLLCSLVNRPPPEGCEAISPAAGSGACTAQVSAIQSPNKIQWGAWRLAELALAVRLFLGLQLPKQRLPTHLQHKHQAQSAQQSSSTRHSQSTPLS